MGAIATVTLLTVAIALAFARLYRADCSKNLVACMRIQSFVGICFQIGPVGFGSVECRPINLDTHRLLGRPVGL